MTNDIKPKSEIHKLEDRIDGATFAVLIDNNYLTRAYNTKKFSFDLKKFSKLIYEDLPGQCNSATIFVPTDQNNKQEKFILTMSR